MPSRRSSSSQEPRTPSRARFHTIHPRPTPNDLEVAFGPGVYPRAMRMHGKPTGGQALHNACSTTARERGTGSFELSTARSFYGTPGWPASPALAGTRYSSFGVTVPTSLVRVRGVVLFAIAVLAHPQSYARRVPAVAIRPD